MGRHAREESRTGYYHVMQRGAGKQILFEDEWDYRRYLEKLDECKEKQGISIIAYCLMNNHVHLLVYTENLADLSRMMSSLGTSYAAYYNVKYEHVGNVFQGRYLSECINDESYLLACVRYIHNNPVKAGFASREKYSWSSYCNYLSEWTNVSEENGRIAVDTSIVRAILGSKEAFMELSASLDDKVFIDYDDELVSCSIGLDVVQKHFGNNFDTSLKVKQLCTEDRNAIIKEMRAVGLNCHQIELLTGVSRKIVYNIVERGA